MKTKIMMMFAAVLAALFASAPAFAQSTTAGTTVNNTATLTYQTGAVTQPTVTSNTATFVVDRKVNLTVAESGNAVTQVVGGQTAAVTTFTVTNNTNDSIDVLLSAANLAGGQIGPSAPFTDTDTFDMSNVKIYVDTNGDGVFNAGDTLVTYLDEMTAGQTRTVFVVADVPVGQANGTAAGVSLTGTAAAAGGAGAAGAVYVATAGADNPAAIDNVLADIAGTDDAAKDGKSSARDEYKVVSPTITFTKKVRVVSDPINGTTNPKAIPGATLEYCLIATNTGGAAATNVIMSDPVPSQTTYVSGLAGAGVTGSGATINCDPATPGTAAGVVYTPTTFQATIATLAAGASVAATFQVTVK